MIDKLYQVICDRRDNPRADSYVASLINQGPDAILQKIGEETTEVILAAKNRDFAQKMATATAADAETVDTTTALVQEIADLTFHTLVLMAEQNLPPAAINDELKRRFGTSGLAEKAGRK